ncbi:MAG: hypothetical protein ABL875_01945, partial [Candidatus Nitrotoga sp.]
MTITLRLKPALVRPRVLPMAPAANVLAKVWLVPVTAGTRTRALIVQMPLWPMVPPVREMLPAPGVAETLPLTAP